MGAIISSSISMGLTYCCCTAAGSLCNACLGSTAPGTTGRKRSVLLLTLAITLALWFQYAVGPALVDQNGQIYRFLKWVPGLGKHIHAAWYNECHRMLKRNHHYQYRNPDDANTSQESIDEAMEEQEQWRNQMLQQCAGMSGVYRPMAVTTLFFILSAVAAKAQPALNREAWPAKFSLFLFVVTMTLFMDSSPIFTLWFLWMARLGASLFCVLQQVILVDVAYNWNEDWVERADEADRVEYGSGSAWLQAIVATCIGFYTTTILGIALLYQYFDGCPGNVWIITLTLIGIVALTAIQLSGSEGSLLTSSIISLYVTYLAYSMVAKNPNGACNPQLGGNDVTGIVIGLTLTAVSLAWTGWSWTAQERLNVEGMQAARPVASSATRTGGDGGVDLDVPFLDPSAQPTQGMVLDSVLNEDGTEDGELGGAPGSRAGGGSLQGSDLWKLNVVMALISCWVAMILTGWGSGGHGLYSIEHQSLDEFSHNEGLADQVIWAAANPTVGRMNMAMIGLSQWTTILLYIWTLVAPRLFPDREFS